MSLEFWITALILVIILSFIGVIIFFDLKQRFYKNKRFANRIGLEARPVLTCVLIEQHSKVYKCAQVSNSKMGESRFVIFTEKKALVPIRIVKRHGGLIDHFNMAAYEALNAKDPDFNQLFYVECPHPSQAVELLLNDVFRAGIRQLWEKDCVEIQWDFNLRTVWLQRAQEQLTRDDVLQTIVFIAELEHNWAKLTEHNKILRRETQEAQPIKNNMLLHGFFALGALFFASLSFLFLIPYWPLEAGALFYSVVLISIPFILVHGLWLKRRIKNQIQGLQAWMVFSIVGIFSFPLSLFCLGVLVNGVLDTSEPMIWTSIIYEKNAIQAGNTKKYEFTIDHWQQTKPTQFDVGYGLYQQALVGDEIRITIHTGALGYKWLGDTSVVQLPNSTSKNKSQLSSHH